jgi:hypothetical protein
MSDAQREITAKFLYDIAKGIALVTLISPWVNGQQSLFLLMMGITMTGALFGWAFWLQREEPKELGNDTD